MINLQGTPVVGICFGHQIIGRALGSRVGRNTEGWEIAVSTVDLTEAGKELFGKDVLVQSLYHSLEASLTEAYSVSSSDAPRYRLRRAARLR